MAFLSTVKFTANLKAGEVATAPIAPATSGWQNIATTISTLAGDDTIQSFAVCELGAVGAVPVLPANDAYYVTAPATLASLYSASIANGGAGVIDMGAGKDTLSGMAYGTRSIGILNGKIGGANTAERMVMGIGDDTIIGQNVSGGLIHGTYGIYNTGTIDLGVGNDGIQGIKASTAATGAAIFNNGSILGGDGNDSFDALTGGWAGNGTVNGGNGADVVMGFGSGSFDGGAGAKDELMLGEGAYTVKYNAVPTASTASFQLTRAGSAGIVMNCQGFEAIGSALKPLLAGVHPQAIGGLRVAGFTIDALGDFTTQTFARAGAPL